MPFDWQIWWPLSSSLVSFAAVVTAVTQRVAWHFRLHSPLLCFLQCHVKPSQSSLAKFQRVCRGRPNSHYIIQCSWSKNRRIFQQSLDTRRNSVYHFSAFDTFWMARTEWKITTKEKILQLPPFTDLVVNLWIYVLPRRRGFSFRRKLWEIGRAHVWTPVTL